MGLYILISVLILIVCFLLGLIVLVQDSKGGGLASNFSAQNQYMGVRKTADFLEKSTWTLALLLLAFSLLSVIVLPRSSSSDIHNPDIENIQQRASEAVNYMPPPTQDAPPATPNQEGE
ncbi:MAG: preprotein translocase subunit SecG [Bacteroidales bacterium]|jgi:preprotein translocase subunit SecG|nr:preprotein translocase subunit SecG [Bacteroidales bacterium]